jgi:glucose dehydrogenase
VLQKFFALLAVPTFSAVAAQTVDWPIYGGGPDNIRYSQLRQITRHNVQRLQVAWSFDSEDAFPGSELQCNPIIVEGVLYATTPKLNVIALDAATGRLIWRFNPNEETTQIGKNRNRGVTYWSNGSEKRIFSVSHAFLYSLDAKTGNPDLNFGENGHIDLRDNLGRNPRDAVSLNTPGVIYKNLLIVGSIVGETLPTSPGDIRAYDLLSGKLRWSFHTIPHPGEFGYNTWPPNAWNYSGGANNWTGMTLDEKRGLIFAPTGSAAYDFYGDNRIGKNLFANCLLALKAETGERVWHFQTVHHDMWDRDLPSPPSLVRVKHAGHMVDAVAQTTKSGWVYLFERETGKPLFPIRERSYPPSELDGEKAAATQPLPELPPHFSRQILTADMLTTRTAAAHQAVLDLFKKTLSAGQFVPPSKEGTIIFPGFDGGAEWGGSAFDPATGHLFVNANEMAWILRMFERPSGAATGGKEIYLKECSACHRPDRSGSPPEFPSLLDVASHYTDEQIAGLLYSGSGRMPAFARLGDDGVKAVLRYAVHGEDVTVAPRKPLPTDGKYINNGYTKFLDPDGYPAVKPPWGTLSSIDLNRGKIAWQIPLGEYPELAAKGLANTGSENYGGPVVTAGGVLFIAATSYDRKFRAFDKDTGKLLWETTLPASGNATPATYGVRGKQYVVIAAGGGKGKQTDKTSGSFVAFALPD